MVSKMLVNKFKILSRDDTKVNWLSALIRQTNSCGLNNVLPMGWLSARASDFTRDKALSRMFWEHTGQPWREAAELPVPCSISWGKVLSCWWAPSLPELVCHCWWASPQQSNRSQVAMVWCHVVAFLGAFFTFLFFLRLPCLQTKWIRNHNFDGSFLALFFWLLCGIESLNIVVNLIRGQFQRSPGPGW